VTGIIDLTGQLVSRGRILIDGLCDGDVNVGGGTSSATLIHLLGGIGSDGVLEFNDDSASSSDGPILVGTGKSTTPLPDITYDGTIRFLEDNSGDITIRGCHDTTDDLDLCFCGSNSGTVTIDQTGCTNQVSYSCVSGCP